MLMCLCAVIRSAMCRTLYRTLYTMCCLAFKNKTDDVQYVNRVESCINVCVLYKCIFSCSMRDRDYYHTYCSIFVCSYIK